MSMSESITDSSKKRLNLITVMNRLKMGEWAVGLESLRRSMKNEDEILKRTQQAYHEALHGSRGEIEEADDMGHFVLGDMITNHESKKKNNSGLLKAGLLTAAVASSGGLGFAIPSILDALENSETVVVPKVEEKPSIGFLKLGEPD